jgi:hypothetical protein
MGDRHIMGESLEYLTAIKFSRIMVEVHSTDFKFETDEEALNFLGAIVEAMVQLFKVNSTDCIECINQAWSDMPIVGSDYVYHESPEYWANHFMYGKSSYWWVSDREVHGPLKPLPYWFNKVVAN